MMSGISSPDGYSPRAFVTRVQPGTPDEAPVPPAPEPREPPVPVELPLAHGRDSEVESTSHGRDRALLDLAARRFAQILPQLESATSPVE